MKAGDIRKVACIGLGIIGSSWAVGFALKGLETEVFDSNPEVMEKCRERVRTSLVSLADNGAIAHEQVEEIEKKVHYAGSVEEAVKDVQFVQESIIEYYEPKQQLLAECEKYMADDTIFASSSSALLISEIAKNAAHPERCIGAHPYNPPHLIPLVEITRIEGVSEEAAELARDFYKSIGKEPVILKKECLGYISNRLQQSIYREVMDLVTKGVCTIEEADTALTFGPGLRWGIMGQNLIWGLNGGEGGIRNTFSWAANSMNLVYKDLANLDHMSEEWVDVAAKGLDEAIAHRAPETGNDYASILKWRDRMLIGLLRMHGKL